jgi:cyclic lactone autoinducer peptide
MLSVLSRTGEKTMVTILGLLSILAMLAAQLSANGCLLATFEQPKMPSNLIKED